MAYLLETFSNTVCCWWTWPCFLYRLMLIP